MHPSKRSSVNLRDVNFSVHRSYTRRRHIVALSLFIIGLMAGLTLAGWIAGLNS